MSRKNGGIIGPANTPAGGLVAGVAGGVWRMNDLTNFVSNNQWPKTPENIENSCRFDDGSSDNLTKTFGSAGNRNTFTLSAWVKRAALTTSMTIFGGGADDNNRLVMSFGNADDFKVTDVNSGSGTAVLTTDRLFRDVAAWYHIVVAYDTTQSTDSNRVKLYINGVQETSFSSTNYPSQNADQHINGAVGHFIASNKPSSPSNYFDGYMAEVVFIDGQQLTPSSFGETDSTTGIWKPKKIGQIANAGTNSFYLNFKDSSNVGKDESGLSNNFTVNNLTSVDQSTDTCINNFCTWNGIIRTDATLAEGNLEMSGGALSYDGTVGTIIPTQGKWYAEIKVTVPTNLQIGFITEGTFIDGKRALYTSGSTIYWQDNVTTIRYYLKGVVQSGYATVTGGSNSVSTYTTNDIIMLAMDLDNGYGWFGKNGTWENSGDPAGGTNAFNLASDYADGTTIFSGQNNSAVQANFGSPPYSISSGNSDANGHGNFEYAVPSGYYALNTSNLNTYG